MQSREKVTMQRIADRLGVTKVSVSKALNNQPGVGIELKNKIIAAARDMGYASQHKPRTGTKRFEFVIAKRFFLENDKFYTVIYYAIAKLCKEQNIRLSLCVVGSTDESILALPAPLLDDEPDGIFVCGEMSPEYTAAIVDLSVPTVLIDFCMPTLPVDSIVVDNYFASFYATTFLIGQGHRQIGFVGDMNFANNIMDRYLGYVKALRMNNLPVVESWLIVNNDKTGYYNLQYSLPDPLPTAFLCHCDMAAYHLMLKLRAEGRQVPDQISLMSFDNTDLSKSSSPALSTVDIDKERMAGLAFQRLLELTKPADMSSRIVMDTNIVVRDSVRRFD